MGHLGLLFTNCWRGYAMLLWAAVLLLISTVQVVTCTNLFHATTSHGSGRVLATVPLQRGSTAAAGTVPWQAGQASTWRHPHQGLRRQLKSHKHGKKHGNKNATTSGVPVCNPYNASWVPDTFDRPVYTAKTCPFLAQESLSCTAAASVKDYSWLKWSWKPQGSCPGGYRFDALQFLGRMKNKVIATVGDSLIYSDFFPALLCQINQVSPVTKDTDLQKKYSAQAYLVKAYGVVLLRYWSPYMVAYSYDDKVIGPLGGSYAKGNVAVNLYTPDPTWASNLKAIDLVIMRTGHHWLGRTFYLDQNWKFPAVRPNITDAFRIAAKTILPLFNQPGSPALYFLSTPNRDACEGTKGLRSSQEVEKLFSEPGSLSGTWFYLQEQLFSVGTNKYIDITHMSLYRPDGHYGAVFPGAGACDSHYCIEGVPDSWVDVFYMVWRQDGRFR